MTESPPRAVRGQQASAQPLSDVHAQWFLRERGITAQTLASFGVTSEPDGAIVMPYPKGPKLRYGIPSGERRFRYPKGQAVDLYRPPAEQGWARTVCICEGETDTMRLWQELAEVGVADRYSVAGLPGIGAWNERIAKELRGCGTERILVFLDADETTGPGGYEVGKLVDQCWTKIRRSLGTKVRRIRLEPSGCKDLCEFFQRFSIADMRGLIDSQPNFNYPSLSLDDPPDEVAVDWMVRGWFAHGDRVLLAAEPGVGKSWIAQDLAVAVAETAAGTDRRWLGERVDVNTGRVLIVDEENPEGEVYRRLKKLGLSRPGAAHIRYLSQAGVRLDKEPELLLDDMMTWLPDLVIIDSLARVHSGDEQSAGEMARLFRDGITPLAREVGAAVMIIHHMTKPQKGEQSGYSRVRGSGDLTASIDQGLDLRAAEYGLQLRHYKSRRSIPHRPVDVVISDEGDQRVTVLAP